MTVTKESSCNCPKCGKPMRQDPDTLDTWFSSALWPFSTLGWPENTEDLKYFYPTNTLVTGYDIIFFWVIRMMFSGLENMGIPTEREVVTILRAPHKYKDSREQFERRTHKRLIDIVNPNPKTVDAMMKLELPAGVDIEMKL